MVGMSPRNQEEARDLDKERVTLSTELNNEERVSEYFLVRQQLERTSAEVRRVVQRPENCLPYVQASARLQLRDSQVAESCVPQLHIAGLFPCFLVYL